MRMMLEISKIPFQCTHCEDEFPTLSTVGHVIDRHGNVKKHLCYECAYELMQPDFDDLSLEIKSMMNEGFGVSDIRHELQDKYDLKVSCHAISRVHGKRAGWKPKIRRQLVKDYQVGMGVDEIAYVYDLSKRAVRRMLLSQNVKLRKGEI